MRRQEPTQTIAIVKGMEQQQQQNRTDIRLLTKTRAVSTKGAGVLVREIVKHLLYMRQQIPMPFDDLLVEIERNVDLVKINSKSIRIRKFVEDITLLLQDLEELYANISEIQDVQIIFGSSLQNPQEIYVFSHLKIYFNDFLQTLEFPSPFDDSKKSSMKKKSREAIRTLMTDENASSTFAQSLSTCKLFVVVRQTLSSAMKELPLDNNSTRGFVSKQKFVTLSCLLLTRNRLNVKMRKKTKCIHFTLGDSKTETTCERKPREMDQEYIWYQFRHLISGIKSKSL